VPQAVVLPQERSVSEMETLLYILVVCLTAVGLDWALYNGAYRSIQAFFRIPVDIGYRTFLFPRIVLVVLSGIIVAIATLRVKADVPMALTGFAIFLVVTVYPQVRTFMAAERY